MEPSFDIDPIVLKYVRGEDLSADETARLRQWMSEGKDRQATLERLANDPAYLQSELLRLRQIDTEAIWSRLENRIRPKTPITHHSRRLRWIFFAASVMIVVGAGGAWLWFSGHRPTRAIPAVAPAVAKTDVQPGGNKAVLTLADGRRIDLGTTANGVLADQGATKVSKVSAGQLAYHKDPASARPVATAYNSLTTPPAGQFKLRLPDGTLVWLNNASILRFPVAFTGADRTVELAGEAYFEVARDPGHPFRVLVHKGAAAAGLSNLSSYSQPVADETGDIEVLGTSFNVMAYSDEPAVRTTLLEGSVRVSENHQTTLLRPDEQSALDAHGKLRVVPEVNVRQVVAWKDGYFNFENASLETTMRQIARWYDIEVVYRGQVPAQEFEGRIQRDLPLSDILKGLENEHIHFKLQGRQLIVMP
jgi:ferric-dicitrate binding protein FerR (iron transport regulator)